MIDLHSHILPGVDDGAQTVDDAIAMAKAAVASGITHLMCTPHHNNGRFNNVKEDIIRKVADLQATLDSENVPLILFEGQEVRIGGDLSAQYEQGLLLGTDMDDKYMLIEFPSDDVPLYTEQVFFELFSLGVTPVIVHPERNSVFIEEPDKLIPFLEMGVLAQMTAPSLVGVFGKKIERVSHQMLKHNMVHTIASDAHNLTGRRFYLKEAYKIINDKYGVDKLSELEDITKALVNGDNVKVSPYTRIKKKFGIF